MARDQPPVGFVVIKHNVEVHVLNTEGDLIFRGGFEIHFVQFLTGDSYKPPCISTVPQHIFEQLQSRP